MYDDKLITNYNEKTKVLSVRTNQTQTFEQQIALETLYPIKDLKDETHFFVQLKKEGEDYVFNVEGLDEDEQPENYDIYDILNNQDITISKGEEFKYALVDLRIQNGEYEYYIKSVNKIPTTQSALTTIERKSDIDQCAENKARDFYGKFSYNDGANYFFNGGEVATRVEMTREITEKEYELLSQFL